MSRYDNQNKSTYVASSAEVPENQNESKLVNPNNTTPDTRIDADTGARVPDKRNLLKAAGISENVPENQNKSDYEAESAFTPLTFTDKEGNVSSGKFDEEGRLLQGKAPYRKDTSASIPANQNTSEYAADNFDWWQKVRNGLHTAEMHMQTKPGMATVDKLLAPFGLDLSGLTNLNSWLKRVTGGHGAGYLMNKSEVSNSEIAGYINKIASNPWDLVRIALDVSYREYAKLQAKGKVPGTQEWAMLNNTASLRGKGKDLGFLGSLGQFISGANPTYSAIDVLRYSITSGEIINTFDNVYSILARQENGTSNFTELERPWISDYWRLRDFEMSDSYYWGIQIRRYTQGRFKCLLPPIGEPDFISSAYGSKKSSTSKFVDALSKVKDVIKGTDSNDTEPASLRLANEITYENGWWPVTAVSFTKTSLRGKSLNVPDFELNIPFATDYPKDISITVVDDARRTFRSWLDNYVQLVYNKSNKSVIPYKHLLFNVIVYNYDCTYSVLNQKSLLCIISDYTNPFISSDSHTNDEIEITMEIVGEIIDTDKDAAYLNVNSSMVDTSGEIKQSSWISKVK